ncbi:MAG: Sua5/YciO/YrdC/YwlC family protein, partial [Myxococcales bacterium]|nr:Sua5/YciO/YrdC/YwlC family protein [Myxococcales bacterium]
MFTRVRWNADTDLSALSKQAAEVLADEGLVCLPCGGTYRIIADLNSSLAVSKLFQSKRRRANTPTLVFVSSVEMLASMTPSLEPVTRTLIESFWPSNLTVLVDPDLNLRHKLVKQMCQANGRVGVRIPVGDVAFSVAKQFNGPLLVSSANIQKKSGAYSAAQVQKNFFNVVDLFIDAGDLTDEVHST